MGLVKLLKNSDIEKTLGIPFSILHRYNVKLLLYDFILIHLKEYIEKFMEKKPWRLQNIQRNNLKQFLLECSDKFLDDFLPDFIFR